MDNIIRKIITIALPAVMLFIATAATGKSGDDAVWAGLRKIGISFGPLVSLGVLVLVGLAANAFSHFAIDGLLVRYYQQRRELEPQEKLVAQINKLPITEDLKIKLKWTVASDRKIISFNHLILRCFITATILTALFSIGGHFGQFNRFFELNSHFKVQYLLIGLCAAIFFAIARSNKLWLLVSICCVAINLVEILPWYWPQPAFAGTAAKHQVRLLHSNVLTSNERYAELISMVREEQPDIAVFVEVNPDWAKELTVLSDIFPYSFGQQESEKYGSAIYSKFLLENASDRAFAEGRKSIVADVKFPDGVISTLIVAHPPVPVKPTTYLERNQQLAAIGEYVAQTKHPAIVAGDLNATMWSPFYQNMVKTGGLRNARSGFGILPTWPTFMPILYIPIDHCLVTKEIDIIKVRTGRNVGSDHLPLITDLAI
ncbi:MAG: endonuclease/exonuclease/phosphatase family protein [Microcoleus sp.]